MEMSLVLQVFVHKPKYWTNQNFNLIMGLQEKLKDQQNYYNSSCGDNEYLYNPSNSCRDISLKITCEPHGGARGEVRGSPNLQDLSSGHHDDLYEISWKTIQQLWRYFKMSILSFPYIKVILTQVIILRHFHINTYLLFIIKIPIDTCMQSYPRVIHSDIHRQQCQHIAYLISCYLT